MRTIRYPRIEKFRSKTKSLSFFLKLASIWYILIGTGIYLTSNTNASFNDVEVINNHLHTQWENWDKSSLRFQGASGFDCSTGFSQDLINGGDQGMGGPSTYVVYYKELSEAAPNAKDPGKEIFRGEIPALKKSETIKLVYFPTGNPEPGKYKFMAFQRPGHPGQGDLWGDEIQVTDLLISQCSN